MKEFYVGDRVKVKDGYYKKSVIGQLGTVKYLSGHDREKAPAMGIEFDKSVGGHNGNGYFNGKWGHCWIVDNEYVTSADSDFPTIVIITDGKTTTATMRKGRRVLKEATVSLYYKDKFSLATGAEEVLKKLFGKSSKVKEVKRRAKPGEYIKIVNPVYSFNRLGDILRIDGIHDGCSPFVYGKNHPRKTTDDEDEWNYSIGMYVVLENYKPQEDK
ncbi:hypothetical protein [Caproicibacterium amylolyticum]|uniref:Uncharacterized protein n=1 Tax=Caproicibacterium amylolyticum TaxID=2766537 RepID=A0A7G9WJU7_9FIRM|nr:hypothetical protein [Caproicibacterium amylolyticum]QNO18959.1 hypothetical protein H6X83_04860 [Caproicibacterium amylolyticum]